MPAIEPPGDGQRCVAYRFAFEPAHWHAMEEVVRWVAGLGGWIGVAIPESVRGTSLLPCLTGAKAGAHDAVLFGQLGAALNFTDGRHTCFLHPVEGMADALYQYTLMPTHMRHTFPVEELRGRIGLAEPFSFTKGCRTMKIDGGTDLPGKEKVERDFSTRLYDLESDPGQRQPIENPAVEECLEKALVAWMRLCDAPSEQFVRLGLSSI